MKKLIAILVVFALATGVAFAQLGGQLQMGYNLLEGNNVRDNDVMSGGSYMGNVVHESKLSMRFGDGQGGGRVVWDMRNQLMWGWLQWRPTQHFGVRVGADEDGVWGFPQIAGWGFTGEAKNSVAAVNDWGGDAGIAFGNRNQGLGYGGFDGVSNYRVAVSAYPTDLLQIHLMSGNFMNSIPAKQRLAELNLIAQYLIEEVGTVRFAFRGDGGLAVEEGEVGDVGNIFIAFHSPSLVPNLAFELGANIDLPRLNESDTFDNINIGYGVNFTQEAINLKVRGNVGFGGKNKGADRDPTFGIHVLPNYRINNDTIVFFHAGAGFRFEEEETAYDFFINPYVWIRASEGLRFWAGFQLIDKHAARDDGKFQFDWRIPFGFNFYF